MSEMPDYMAGVPWEMARHRPMGPQPDRHGLVKELQELLWSNAPARRLRLPVAMTWIYASPHVDPDVWRDAFRRVGYLQWQPTGSPPMTHTRMLRFPIPLYRGATPANAAGFSWTAQPAIAMLYALRHADQEPRVWMTHLRRRADLYARFRPGPKEPVEWVVEPNALDIVEYDGAAVWQEARYPGTGAKR